MDWKQAKTKFFGKKIRAPGRGQAGRSRGKWGLTGVDVFLCWSPNLTMSQVQVKETPPREEEVIFLKDGTGIQTDNILKNRAEIHRVLTHVCVRWLCWLNEPEPGTSAHERWHCAGTWNAPLGQL